MESKQNTWTLITGASAGIGAELARVFAREGHNLVLVARDEGRLAALKAELQSAVAVETLSVDLARSGACENLFHLVQGKVVNTLVNNAGFGAHGLFVKSTLERQLEMIQLNVAALTALTRLFLPGMVERGEGRVLNVASTAAFQPGPYMAVYYASKAYVLSFSEAIAEELRETGVTVTALCPGPTATEFAKTANAGGTNMFKGPFVMTARDVAEIGYHATLRGKRVAVAGALNSIAAGSVRFLPRSVVTRISKKIAQATTP